ncbi:hypothetical protein VNO77_33549 [Canavalia gladiata]|uniref:Uncharacterized protein n=1 Tax=Canavalia gladiata TaxID=3824 RepID=A0AAN9PYF6_CANGL
MTTVKDKGKSPGPLSAEMQARKRVLFNSGLVRNRGLRHVWSLWQVPPKQLAHDAVIHMVSVTNRMGLTSS